MHLEPGHLIFVIDRHGSAPTRRASASPAFGRWQQTVGLELGGDLLAHSPAGEILTGCAGAS
jgi:hypothetical protein